MGRKVKWFNAVKKVFSPESKEKKIQTHESKRKWGIGKSNHSDPTTAPNVSSLPHPEEITLVPADAGQSSNPYPVAIPTAATAAGEAAVSALQTPAVVIHLSEEVETAAAIKIQTAFRGYMARRALRALRGLVRLKSLIDGDSVKRQAMTTLRCMQTLARVQSQIRSRRIRMSEENQALQRQLLLKRESQLESLRVGGEWDDSLQSKEQIEASLLSKTEASIKRERALAYAFSHQWKNSSKTASPLFMDPNTPHWGWSWLERWMAARPWESHSASERDLNNDLTSVKSNGHSVGGEISNTFARRDTNSDKPSPQIHKSARPANYHSPSTPLSKAQSIKLANSTSPRTSLGPLEDDMRSTVSMQSERNRRHSIAGSSVTDDESLASSPALPSYMAPTKSARAKSRFQSPSVDEMEKTPDKVSVGSVKKRLSFPVASPARRHSGPPKMDIASIKDLAAAVH